MGAIARALLDWAINMISVDHIISAVLAIMAIVPLGIWLARKIVSLRERRRLFMSLVIGIACVVVLGVIVLGTMTVINFQSNDGQEIKKTERVERLVKNSRVNWDPGGRVSLQGRYVRSGGPISVYVTYESLGNGSNRQPNTVLSATGLIEPRIKVDLVSHFDREEMADLTLGFVTRDNGLILQWGQPKENKTKIGITLGTYFGNVIVVDGEHEEQYPFAIVATYQRTDIPAAQQPPPILIGPDILLTQQKTQQR